MNIDKTAISNNIAKYRIIANISQKAVADKTGLNRNYISVLESAKGNLPSMKALDDIAAALNTDIDKLLFENLVCFSSENNDDEFNKELQFMTLNELEVILSFVRVYSKYKKKIFN